MSVEAINGLSNIDLTGVELAIAREDFCCSIKPELRTSLIHREKALKEFVSALHEAFFGQAKLVDVNTIDEAAELIKVQLGCLATVAAASVVDNEVPDQAQIFRAGYISGCITDNVERGATLPESVELTVRSIAEPYIYTPDASAATV